MSNESKCPDCGRLKTPIPDGAEESNYCGAADAGANVYGWQEGCDRATIARLRSELTIAQANVEALQLCLDTDKWIKTAERLPPNSDDVLGWAPGYSRPLVWAWHTDHNCWSSPHGPIIAEAPTHWRLLPLSPEQLEKSEW